MKKLKALLLLTFCLFGTASSYSQQKDEVTLVVSADGTSKEEATKIALRNAIEQTYGTFVSANTTILNDDLVKDEIVTISNGNIKGYKEVSFNTLPDGKMFITLEATVSISKLVSYAQSKGAEAEFAGATFGMNMKMKELNKSNEKKALENLLIQIQQLLPISYSKSLMVDVTDCSDEVIGRKFIDEYMRKEYIYNKFNLKNLNNYYLAKMYVFYLRNENTQNLYKLIHSTLNSLSLKAVELEEYKKAQISYKEIKLSLGNLSSSYCLRSSKEELDLWLRKLSNLFTEEFSNFKIVDNLGNSSSFDGAAPLLAKEHGIISADEVKKRNVKIEPVRGREENYIIEGKGLFNPIFVCQPCFHELYIDDYINTISRFQIPYTPGKKKSKNQNLSGRNIYDIYAYMLMEYKNDYARGSGDYSIISKDNDYEGEMHWTFSFFIPKADISKYSNFKVERLND